MDSSTYRTNGSRTARVSDSWVFFPLSNSETEVFRQEGLRTVVLVVRKGVTLGQASTGEVSLEVPTWVEPYPRSDGQTRSREPLGRTTFT